MSNDELNKKIYEDVLKEANTVFEHVMIPDGSYTASALSKLSDNGQLFINPIIDITEKAVIQIEHFKCSFLKGMVFHILNKFEKLARIKNKYMFSKITESDVPVLSFSMSMTNQTRSLINAVSSDDVRVALTRILVDYKRGQMIASDGHILMVRHFDISNVHNTEDLSGEYVYITGEMLKHADLSQVSFYKTGEYTRKVTLKDVKGDIYTCTYDACERYPNWEGCIPDVLTDGCFRFSEQTVSNIRQWITMCCNVKSSTCKNPIVRFTKGFFKKKYNLQLDFQSHSRQVYITLCEKENPIQENDFELEQPSLHTISISLAPNNILSIPDWNGTLWMKGNSYGVLFDTELQEDVTLVMPLRNEKLSEYSITGKAIPYHERHKHTPSIQQETEQEPIKTPVEEQDYSMLMATKNNTEKRYCIDDLIEGSYEIREKQHDPDLLLAIRSMAHYTKGREELQIKLIERFKERYGTPINNPDYFLNYPLPESELAETFAEVFAAEGIDEIPDYPAADTSEQMHPEPDVESEPDVETEVETEVEPDEQQEEELQQASSRSGLTGGKCIVPIMTLETDQGPLIISTFESFTKLDESNDPRDKDLIERIDAFITSETFNADPIDYEAIASEVEEFLELVEEQNHRHAI